MRPPPRRWIVEAVEERVEGDPVTWWGWLLLVWPVLALGIALWLGSALGIADRRDWRRRGSADRRARSRGGHGHGQPGRTA